MSEKKKMPSFLPRLPPLQYVYNTHKNTHQINIRQNNHDAAFSYYVLPGINTGNRFHRNFSVSVILLCVNYRTRTRTLLDLFPSLNHQNFCIRNNVTMSPPFCSLYLLSHTPPRRESSENRHHVNANANARRPPPLIQPRPRPQPGPGPDPLPGPPEKRHPRRGAASCPRAPLPVDDTTGVAAAGRPCRSPDPPTHPRASPSSRVSSYPPLRPPRRSRGEPRPPGPPPTTPSSFAPRGTS